jgi:hypothetical protein
MAPRPQAVPRQQKLSDPIFSKPYEPSAARAGAPAASAAPQPASRQRARPVAALLGGLKRAPSTA